MRAWLGALTLMMASPLVAAQGMADGERMVGTVAVHAAMKSARACYDGTLTIIGLHALREKGVAKTDAVAFYRERGGFDDGAQELIDIAYSVQTLSDDRVVNQYEKCLSAAQAELTEMYAK